MIEYHVVKSISYADFPSLYWYFERPPNENDCVSIQPVPVYITELVKDAR